MTGPVASVHTALYCLAKVRGPLFVTVPNKPLEVMSVVPVKEVPFTVL